MDVIVTALVAGLLGFLAGAALTQTRVAAGLEGRLSGLQEHLRTLAEQNRRWDEWLADTNRRGAVAEQQAENLLRAAGLRPDVDYLTQRALPGGDRPDLTLRLPLGRVLHLDAKFPLPAYRRWAEAGTEADRRRHRADFVKAVGAHVDALVGRGYADDPEGVGFVVLYLPYEAALELLGDGHGSLVPAVDRPEVVLCTPMTLRPLLRIVRRAVDAIMVERNTEEILAVLDQVQHRWDDFVAAGGGLDTLGRHLTNAHNLFFTEVARRRGDITRQLAEVERLRLPDHVPGR
jgi:DNA anti-recombination protein RmuC